MTATRVIEQIESEKRDSEAVNDAEEEGGSAD
jgi:hypothetical protein